MRFRTRQLRVLGGVGSGNFGHSGGAGGPGNPGGSTSDGGGGALMSHWRIDTDNYQKKWIDDGLAVVVEVRVEDIQFAEGSLSEFLKLPSVQEMALEIRDGAKFVVPEGFYSESGQLKVTDGQHRISAWFKNGHKVIPMLVTKSTLPKSVVRGKPKTNCSCSFKANRGDLRSRVARLMRRDPIGIAGFQRVFLAAIRKRLTAFERLVVEAVEKDDVLGLDESGMLRVLGGVGSGNFGHSGGAGGPGNPGGSTGGGGGGSFASGVAVSKYESAIKAKTYGTIGDVREFLAGNFGSELAAKLPKGMQIDVRVGIVPSGEVAYTQPSTRQRGPRIILPDDPAMLMREMANTTSLQEALGQVLAHEMGHVIADVTGGDFTDETVPNSYEAKAVASFRPIKTNALPRRKFAFKTKAEKHSAFMDWLDEQARLGVLGVEKRQPRQATTSRWSDIYIQSAYKNGMLKTDIELRAAGIKLPEPIKGKRWIDSAFNMPIHADRVAQLYTRAYEELNGITAAMSQQMSRVLAQGMADGLHPRQMAMELRRAAGIGRKRAELIARTETMRAHHVGTINSYREAGIEGVKIKAELLATPDDRCCDVCLELEEKSREKPYTLDEAESLIPVHPNCRCTTIAVFK